MFLTSQWKLACVPKSIKLIKLEESRFQGQIVAYALRLPLAIQFCHYKTIKMISQLSYFIQLQSKGWKGDWGNI